jgi:hypothetical protein
MHFHQKWGADRRQASAVGVSTANPASEASDVHVSSSQAPRACYGFPP